MQSLFQELQDCLAAHQTVALATLVRRRGSVPREIGAKMLVQRDGKISGTVGGGCGEAEVWRTALSVIDTRRPKLVQVDLTEEIAIESQGVCGGVFDVFIQPWFAPEAPDLPNMQSCAAAICAALEGEQAVALATVISGTGAWRARQGQQLLIHENGTCVWGGLDLPDAPTTLIDLLVATAQQAIAAEQGQITQLTGPESCQADLFIEPFIPPPVLLIAGAGHIAAPLAAIARLLNFAVTVTDDRASLTTQERFPGAQRLLVGEIETTLRDYPITPRTHIVLVTRAHSHDVQGLRAVLNSSATYIGMIGSQRRVWAVFKLLHDEGFSSEQLLRVQAPIGLDLGGSTPEEIALAIMAEITLHRRGGNAQPLSTPLRARYQERLRRLEQHLDEVEM